MELPCQRNGSVEKSEEGEKSKGMWRGETGGDGDKEGKVGMWSGQWSWEGGEKVVQMEVGLGTGNSTGEWRRGECGLGGDTIEVGLGGEGVGLGGEGI